MSPGNGPTLGYVVAGVVIVVVMGIRLFRMRKARPLKLEQLWIIPVLYSAFAAVLFWELPPHGREWSWVAVALGLGGLAGWLRGRSMRITVDPVTHDLNQRQSPIALLIIVALIALRFGARSLLGSDPGHAAHGVIDALAAATVGVLAVQRIEMFLRARRLLGEARALGGPALSRP